MYFPGSGFPCNCPPGWVFLGGTSLYDKSQHYNVLKQFTFSLLFLHVNILILVQIVINRKVQCFTDIRSTFYSLLKQNFMDFHGLVISLMEVLKAFNCPVYSSSSYFIRRSHFFFGLSLFNCRAYRKPPQLRRIVAAVRELINTRRQANSILFVQLMAVSNRRLIFRRSIWTLAHYQLGTLFDTAGAWCASWSNSLPVNGELHGCMAQT